MTDAPKPPAPPPAPTAAPAEAKAAEAKPASEAKTAAAPVAKPAPKPPAAMPPPTEPHYKIHNLNLFFLAASVVCMLTFVLMVWQDWDRDWKGHQKTFQKLLRSRALADKKSEEKMVSESQRKTLEKKVADAEALIEQQRKAVDETAAKLKAAKSVAAIAERTYQDEKANLDAARYEMEARTAEKGYDKARHQRAEVRALETKVDEKMEKAKATRLESERLEAELKALKKPLADADAERLVALGKIERLDDNIRKLTVTKKSNLITMALNTPLLDFAAPPYTIKQTIQDDFRIDMNYQTAGTVDRCQTCHLAIDRPGFEFELNDEGEFIKDKAGKKVPMPQPYRTHPDLELYLGASSPHKAEEFGCTSCHSGRDRGLDFSSAAHTPQNESQAAEWKKKYNWKPIHKWSLPMLPLQNTSAKCGQCHAGQSTLVMKTGAKAGAEVTNNWTLGRDLFDKYGCWGCHKTAGFEGLRKVGPDLTHIAAKLDREWVIKWVSDPFSFRHNTRMPAFFNQANNGGPRLTSAEQAAVDNGSAAVTLMERAKEHRRTDAEINAIVDYLYAKDQPHTVPEPAISSGDAAAGKALFYKIGCAGCHIVGADEKAAGREAWRGPYGRHFGPSLDGVGSKASYKFLYAWIKNPQDYWPESRMPDMRLSENEAADIAAWLTTLKNPAFEKQPTLRRDEKAISEQLTEYFVGKQMPRAAAAAQVEAMVPADRSLMLGEKMLNRYGCFGCHTISGFETAQGIGVELYGASNEGGKPVERLDFGFLVPEGGHTGKMKVPSNFPLYAHDGVTPVTEVERVHHNPHDWFIRKLLEPRIWDLGRDRSVEERTKMPNFHFTEAEAEALTTLILSFTKPLVNPARVARLDGESKLAEQARRYIKDRNCTGCHVNNGLYDAKNPNRNGAIRQVFPAVDDPDTDIDESSENPHQWPPYITGEGAKVQADWLYEFLKSPTMIRPKIKVRMPTFHFTDKEMSLLIAGWNYESKQQFPYVAAYDPAAHAAQTGRGRELFDGAQCRSCHAMSAGDLNREGVNAPNLELSRRRLKADWLTPWLTDPQKMNPGVNMPGFPWDSLKSPQYPDETSAQRVEAVKAYVMSIGN